MATTAKIISKLAFRQQPFMFQVQGRYEQCSILIRCRTFVYSNLKSSVVLLCGFQNKDTFSWGLLNK